MMKVGACIRKALYARLFKLYLQKVKVIIMSKNKKEYAKTKREFTAQIGNCAVFPSSV